VETARHIDKQLSMEDAVALALLITAVTEKALTLCQVGSEATKMMRKKVVFSYEPKGLERI
jgi:hypothetical protein